VFPGASLDAYMLYHCICLYLSIYQGWACPSGPAGGVTRGARGGAGEGRLGGGGVGANNNISAC
jgi:hypothetical protein